MEESGNAYRVFVEKHEGNRSLGRAWRRWDDSIKIYLKERNGLEAVDWVDRLMIVTNGGAFGHGNDS